MSDDKLDDSTDRCLQALRDTLSDERGRWILELHEEAANELPLTLAPGLQHFVIDRSFVADGMRWIIDYKTSQPLPDEDLESFLDREQQHYQQQLAGYGRLLRQLDTRPIRLGLYFPLCRGWCAWDHVDDAT